LNGSHAFFFCVFCCRFRLIISLKECEDKVVTVECKLVLNSVVMYALSDLCVFLPMSIWVGSLQGSCQANCQLHKHNCLWAFMIRISFALYKPDCRWYMCKVLKRDENTAYIEWIEYGSRAWVTLNNLFETVCETPPYAVGRQYCVTHTRVQVSLFSIFHNLLKRLFNWYVVKQFSLFERPKPKIQVRHFCFCFLFIIKLQRLSLAYFLTL